MALGGGTFLVQNKRLPGAYINTVSVAAAATVNGPWASPSSCSRVESWPLVSALA